MYHNVRKYKLREKIWVHVIVNPIQENNKRKSQDKSLVIGMGTEGSTVNSEMVVLMGKTFEI